MRAYRAPETTLALTFIIYTSTSGLYARTKHEALYVCVIVCVVSTFGRLGLSQIWLPFLVVVSRTGKIHFPCAPSRMKASVLRVGHECVLSHISQSTIHTQSESGAYLQD